MYCNNRFKLGDVVKIHNTNYKHYGVVGKVYQISHVITDSSSCIEPEYINYWVVNEDHMYTGLTEADINFAEAPDKTPMQHLKDALAKADQKIKELENLLKADAHCDNSYSKVIDRIARSEKTDLIKGVRAKTHKWVELSEFVKRNPIWVYDNFSVILEHAELFYKKGDLINYSYDRKINKFTFEYAPGITKLMAPIVGFEDNSSK